MQLQISKPLMASVTQHETVPCPSEHPGAATLTKVQPVLETLVTRERQEAFTRIYENNVGGCDSCY
jgi:hypothetical protein